ncbi:Holliday junction resolvase YqgF [Desulfofarcimen acetoxidans DSM 771]|uniref:Putative pre-16S rRNA nuclease n=1 Tax=Desulfofarcimen acetoxidans (strain ATCC 49208 / DSM 771 / KCTC 5769 / VKM B-1644 / 5575) TaxID=485916 RepID=C8VZV1_DESAS|nr:Holliday junction resolvase RuvX [Desulfofarcimen acetoxidans]ACV63079.1 Holliday junction resolvase YqgF [Desulfofarcimen acetoxidans DSM 771]
MRIMCLDLGEKTIGIALSDPFGWTAQGLEIINRKGQPKQELNRLREIIKQYEVEKVVVGLPKNMNGTTGPQAEKALDFIEYLKRKLGLVVEAWDERLSTVAAERILLSADISRGKRKKVIDKMAAAVILQGYLDAHSCI